MQAVLFQQVLEMGEKRLGDARVLAPRDHLLDDLPLSPNVALAFGDVPSDHLEFSLGNHNRRSLRLCRGFVTRGYDFAAW